MKKSAVIAISIILIAGGYFFYKNWLNPSPTIYAERDSGLKLSNNIKVVAFKNEWVSFNGDGTREIQLSIDSQDFKQLEIQCINNGYKPLPMLNNELSIPDISQSDKGYYLFEHLSKNDDRDIKVVIVNFTKKKLYIILSLE